MNDLLPILLRQDVFRHLVSKICLTNNKCCFYKKSNISATPLNIHMFLTLDRDSIRFKEGKSLRGLRLSSNICEIMKNILNILSTKLNSAKWPWTRGLRFLV